MSKSSLPSNLIATPERERFLEELNEHADDAGNLRELGSTEELSDIFNNYARPRRNLRLILIGCVAVYTLVATSGWLIGMSLDATIYEQPFMDQHLWGYFIAMPGFILLIPSLPVVIVLNIALQLLQLQTPLAYQFTAGIAVFTATSFWTFLVYQICFYPHFYLKVFMPKKTYGPR